MAVQYTDGTFGDIKPINEAMQEFDAALLADTAKALHVGSPEEIGKVKQERDMDAAIQKIEDRLKDLEVKNHVGVIHVPTPQDVCDATGLSLRVLQGVNK